MNSILQSSFGSPAESHLERKGERCLNDVNDDGKFRTIVKRLLTLSVTFLLPLGIKGLRKFKRINSLLSPLNH